MKIGKVGVISEALGSKTVISQRGNRQNALMKRVLLMGLTLMAVVLGPMCVYAQSTYYVRADAAGANNGSDWNNAYKSLPATLVRGAVYYVAEGNYGGYTCSTPTSGSTPITIKKATSVDHGTNTGWVDSYGDGQAAFGGQINFTSSYWVFDGVTGGGAGSWKSGFGFKITETSDAKAVIVVGQNTNVSAITVRHVEMQGKGSVSTNGGSYSNDGLAIYGDSNVTLSYAWMYGIGRCPFFVSPINLVVEHVYVQSYNGSSSVHSEVASIWGFAGSVGDTTFRYCLFTDIKSTGGLMWDNSSNTSAVLSVYGNVFYKPSGANWQRANGIIGGWTGGNGEQFRNARVYNNTFINCDQETLSTLPNVYSGNEAYNNLWYNCQSPSFAKFANHDYNHFINSGGNHSEANGTSATSGDSFVDYVNLDFRLKVATAAGKALDSPYSFDPAGVVRGTDGTWDRGAFESGGSSANPKSPSNLQILPQ